MNFGNLLHDALSSLSPIPVATIVFFGVTPCYADTGELTGRAPPTARRLPFHVEFMNRFLQPTHIT